MEKNIVTETSNNVSVIVPDIGLALMSFAEALHGLADQFKMFETQNPGIIRLIDDIDKGD